MEIVPCATFMSGFDSLKKLEEYMLHSTHHEKINLRQIRNLLSYMVFRIYFYFLYIF